MDGACGDFIFKVFFISGACKFKKGVLEVRKIEIAKSTSDLAY